MPTCFVIQGFGEKTDFQTGRKLNLDASYRVIKEAVIEAGLDCIRADEIQHSGTIDVPMYQQILNADLVIADLSTYNVNAAYELGVRYGLRPRCTIVLAEDQFKYPFDVSHIAVRSYRHLGEDIGAREAIRLKTDLKAAIEQILASGQSDSPVYTYLPNLQPPRAGGVMPPVPTPSPATAAASSSSSDTDQNAKQLLDLARAAMAKDDFATAKNLFDIICKMRPHDAYVVQQHALATYKAKQPDPESALLEAHKILQGLNPETTNDPETLGLWGAVHKRLWDLRKKGRYLDEAIAAYGRGFYLKQDHYNGINLAFLLNVRADGEERTGQTAEAIADFIQARRVRKDVIQYCQQALVDTTNSEADKYWIIATLWEAAIGLEDTAEMAKWRQEAGAVNVPGWMRESTQTQLSGLQALLSASPLKHLQAA